MKLTIQLSFLSTKKMRAELEEVVAQGKADVADLKENFQEEVRKAIHGAYAGIVCVECGNNVFRGTGEWIHGKGGKAYCLNPCWNNLKEKKNAKIDND